MATRAHTSSEPSPLPNDDSPRRPAALESETAAFFALLTKIRSEISERLSSLLDAKLREASRYGEDVEALALAIRALTLRGGKRFRPALAFASYRAIDAAADEEPVLQVGVALELLQTYFLVHDDWMDRDDVRRGGPAVHVLLTRHFGTREKGEASGILAGDWAAAVSLQALAGLDVPNQRRGDVFEVFARMQQDAIFGQQLDLAGRPESIELMHELKTGSYTVRGPLLLGASLAGGTREQRTILEAFARPLGVAFQLRDDLLGAFGNPDETGKPKGSDIRAGKRTMLANLALSSAPSGDAKLLEETLGKADASEAEVNEIIRIFESSGARERVEDRLDALVREAVASLDSSHFEREGIELLVGSARALTLRRS